MSGIATAVVAGSVITGVMSSNAQSDAAESAAGAQTEASAASIAEQRRQFDAVQKLLAPYVNAGESAVGGQQDLLGLSGGNAQAAAIKALEKSPQFTSMMKQGENAARRQRPGDTGPVPPATVEPADRVPVQQTRPGVWSRTGVGRRPGRCSPADWRKHRQRSDATRSGGSRRGPSIRPGPSSDVGKYR
jgi:hypothetical protein